MIKYYFNLRRKKMKAEIDCYRLLLYPETRTELAALTAFCTEYRNKDNKDIKFLVMPELVETLPTIELRERGTVVIDND